MDLVTARRLLAAYAMLDGPDRHGAPHKGFFVPGGKQGGAAARAAGETDQGAGECAFHAVTGLLFRLTALTAAHGPDAPARLLDALALSFRASHDVDAVRTVQAFLETGRRPGEAAHTGEVLRALRSDAYGSQATPSHGGDDPCRAAPRCRCLPPTADPQPGQSPFPSSLGALASAISTIRSHLMRDPLLPGPVITGPSLGQQVERETVLISPADHAYALVVAGEGLRSGRGIPALLDDLRWHLTPSDAAWALWAHVHQEQPAEALDFLLVTHDGAPRRTRWAYRPRPRSQPDRDPVRLCRDRLPSVAPVPAHGEVLVAGAGEPVTIRAPAPGIVEVVAERAAGAPVRALVYAAATPATGSNRSAQCAAALVAARIAGAHRECAVVSVAPGRVRLDRGLGPEQETATAVGGAVLSRLLEGASQTPLLTARMDDDGPVVRLSPRNYRAYLRLRLPKSPLVLVPASSPVVRAIATVLYERLLALGLGHRVQRHGGGLFIDLGDGCHRELIADAGEVTSTGGLLLEAALLAYRTDPAGFDAYFQDRFGLPDDPHRAMTDILDEALEHEARVSRLAFLERKFAPVTGLGSADSGVLALVTDVLGKAGPGAIHINVLDDYYADQQQRVRALILLLRLPFRLMSLHYSTVTAEVFLRG
ncbi:hypothetical protein SAMN05428944_0446 [Streptomyces sp. 1222.5]|nr:hypothetical protein BX260_7650 [Streptomyces sp. 5112.2]SEB58738.1 hypothetical protein SAMN05428944_0446 [Streptomyces sp. 1222.5]